MINALYPILRPLIFKLDPEQVHDLTIHSLSRLQSSPLKFLLNQTSISDPYECLGMTFPNRVGLAAGLDKNGACIDAFGAMGFGHIEIGTVTPKPQPGNEKPRLFRLEQHEAIINRMGFNNLGVDQLVENVKSSRFKGILGINIGKNKDTPEDRAVDDYMIGMEKVFPYASYITINISSPNTPGLRNLQFGEVLDSLLKAIKEKQATLSQTYAKQVPVLVKIAPDLSEQEIEQVADSFLRHQIDGVIATNTTLERKAVAGHVHAEEAGGLSGKPVLEKSNQVIVKLRGMMKDTPIFGVGGIVSGQDAAGKISAGADLVQIYSGFIYRGPQLIKEVAQTIRDMK